MSDTLESKLDRMFNARYGQRLADLNKNVYKSPKNSNGGYDVPVVAVGEGGGTVVNNPTKTDAFSFSLSDPAVVTLVQKDMLPYQAIYRLVVPLEECQIAEKNPAYFNYLFDKIMDKAIGNYNITFGGPDIVRFGDMYITAHRPNSTSVFRNYEDSFLELRLYGTWASDYENYT